MDKTRNIEYCVDVYSGVNKPKFQGGGHGQA